MKKYNLGKNLTALMAIWALFIMPLAAFGQTRIVAPKNKYKVQDDVKIGRDAAAQVEQQLPILNDAEATRYLEQVGNRLVNSIPSQFQHPEFDYSFKIVNASDINAFALPGGYMYVNRGMIEAARNEGEMAGVMAHELSHVALRHGTAQATQQSNPLNQILGIGAVLGGAILGGQTGAAIGQTVYRGFLVNPYSRAYETQADTLGAQIMANAGYDPRDLANMFKTIEAQGGGRTPEFLSDHPSPENRYENINREAAQLRVRNPIQNTEQFQRIKSKLSRMPRARSMSEIEKDGQNNQGETRNPATNGRYESRVALPSSRTRVFTAGNALQLNVPSNWEEFPNQSEIWFAPAGAYGDKGITHGVFVGTARPQSRDFGQSVDAYLEGVLQSNNYLRRSSNTVRTSLARRTAYATQLAGRSPITDREELATVYVTQLRSGDLFYVITVVPENEASRYDSAFRNLLNSIRLND